MRNKADVGSAGLAAIQGNVFACDGGGASIAAQYRFELVAAGGVRQVDV
jgi:hypothetical protein